MAPVAFELDAFQFAVSGGSVALGLAAAVWALAERGAARKAHASLTTAIARARAAIAIRDAVLAQNRDAMVAWDHQGQKTFCLGDADALLRGCLEGSDAAALSRALEGLHSSGSAFTLRAGDPGGCSYTVRGRTIGGAAAVWLDRDDGSIDQNAELRTLLDTVPVPIWLRDAKLSLRWANQAFLRATGEQSLDDARTKHVAFDRAEPESAAAALADGRAREIEISASVDGEWRTFSLTHVPLNEASVAGVAVGVGEHADSDMPLKRHLEAHSHLLDYLTTAVVLFGPHRRLEAYNRAFVAMWDLPTEWLNSRPSHEDLLDRLREARRLPEQRDYAAWKRKRLELYTDLNGRIEEIWQVPGRATLRVVGYSNPLGGATFLCEDVTEKFALESSLNTLVATQAATLDVLGEAIAVFGPDGRLALHNAAFAEMWALDRSMLAGLPHIRDIAAACLTKFGDEGMWERLAGTISSSPAQRRNWQEIRRNDGSVLSLATLPLPDRATLMTFADITDKSRIEAALNERNEAMRMLKRLRADYIKQVSYELRTPLNTILGFAEHLAFEARETLNPNQYGQLEAIVAGSYALKTVIDDMLADLIVSDPSDRNDESGNAGATQDGGAEADGEAGGKADT